MRTTDTHLPRSSARILPVVFGSVLIFVAASLAACGGTKDAAPASDSTTATAAPSGAALPLKGPHGGMLVAVGNGVAQLEFNVDTTQGVVVLRVFDGAAKEPIRLTQGRIDMTMLDLVEGGADVTTILAGRASDKTKETIENTSVFVGFVPQLVGHPRFRGRVQRIEIGGQVFTDIPVSYPPGATA